MTCRHKAGDPNCSSFPNVEEYRQREAELRKELAERGNMPATPDSEKYLVLDVAQVGDNLVLRVKYPNCAKCSYEGEKVLVYLDVTPMQALKWKKIDPHFQKRELTRPVTEAPGPDARFPASPMGWADALDYAKAVRVRGAKDGQRDDGKGDK